MEFAGEARPLAQTDIEEAARALGVEPALIAAVAEVESAGAGFLSDGRPRILYEAHVFARLTAHRYNRSHPNISSPTWNRALYGQSGAHQYDRLGEAIALDREAALQSASWGKFQILGQNFAVCGFTDVESFVTAMTRGEAEHLKAFIAFCQGNDLIRHMAVHDWRAFSRGYNGPGQVDYYAGRLSQAYTKHAAGLAGGAPRAKIKRIQEVLGVVTDGAFGRRSRAALNAVLTADGQPGI